MYADNQPAHLGFTLRATPIAWLTASQALPAQKQSTTNVFPAKS